MLWWFEKLGRRTTLEVLQLPDGGYELRFVDATGTERIEHFASVEEAAVRQRGILEGLSARGWRQTGEWKF